MESLYPTSPILYIVDKINELVAYANSDKELLDGFRNIDNSIYNVTLTKDQINAYKHTVKVAGLYRISYEGTSGGVGVTVKENDVTVTLEGSLNSLNPSIEGILLLNGDTITFEDQAASTDTIINIEITKNLVKSIFDNVDSINNIASSLRQEIDAVIDIAKNYETARQELAQSKAQYEAGLLALDIARRELQDKTQEVINQNSKIHQISTGLEEASAGVAQNGSKLDLHIKAQMPHEGTRADGSRYRWGFKSEGGSLIYMEEDII